MKFPAFQVVPTGAPPGIEPQVIVQIALSTGDAIQFDPSQLTAATDLVSVTHPDFETFFAVEKWLAQAFPGHHISELLANQDMQVAYAAADFTPIGFA